MSAYDELYAALTQGVKHAQLRQHHINTFRAEIERETREQVAREIEQQGSRYMLAVRKTFESIAAQVRAVSSSSPAAGDRQPETEVCQCRTDRDGNGEGWIKYRARDGEFVELRCRDHKGGA
ncbi:hypothetical protein QMZ92_23820 [Streptomyces sp. HNM0645]|uniref:hypothetical protein n=1 Tax=Streptomyces sp. HNM0645 TaxID=2782343 RepID=UPI0024B71D52|nr:hypothetical protein [Streptomyces sp. HNM0645]MDI9887314.1 hypothetical protein [Streptomyces sp. HNM0645]